MENGALRIFENSEFGSVRVIEINEEPWWVLADVCRVLELSNPSRVAERLNDDEKQRLDFNPNLKLGLGHNGATVISEPGLYRVILRSDKPKAEPFMRWITHEVIPSIRKHGGYMTPEKVKEILSDPDTIIQLATQLKEERAKTTALKAENAIMQPKAAFADAVAECDSTILVGDLAKLLKQNGYNTGSVRLFAWLRENGYLISRKGEDYNVPTQRSMELGLFRVKETLVHHHDGHTTISKTPLVTGKGQRYFLDRLLPQQKAG